MDPKQIVRDGYDKVSHAYRSASFNYESSEYRTSLSWLEPLLTSGSAVLDLGCGCGIPVSRVLSRQYRVTGVDISPIQIERAHVLAPDAQFICADITTLDFPANTFDAVVAFYSIIHVPLDEQPALLKKIAHWLKPGGCLIASVGHTEWTGTESDWCKVEGATMYWSHADAATYKTWLTRAGFSILCEGFLPEGNGSHTILLCQRHLL
jgi:SAM-dependent methyltransferase